MSNVLKELQTLLEQRKSEKGDSSYVASLYEKGLDKILEKVGEEATEVILAAKNVDQSTDLKDVVLKDLVGETADLWFHSMVMLSHLGGDYEMVLNELEKRFGISGHAEKASRK